MSELSDIFIENVATTRSPTDNTRMLCVMEKKATSLSFSGRVKNTLGNFFPFTMGTGTANEAETQEEENLTSDLKLASIVRLRRMTHTR